MTTTMNSRSADVFDIFTGRRIAANEDHYVERPVLDRQLERNPSALAERGWYHAAAINDEAPDHWRL